MFDLFGAEMPLAVRFFLAFLIVLGLIGVTAWSVRRFGGGRLSNTTRGRQPRLAVIDYASVDARRRLILVRRDNVEHLLMIGGPTDVVVEANIVRATPAARDAPAARPPVAGDTLPRVIPLPEAPSNGSWPLQPEPAGPPIPPAPPRRAPRVEPVQEEPRSFPPPPPPEVAPPRPSREALAALAEDLAAGSNPPLPPRNRVAGPPRPQPNEQRAEDAPRAAPTAAARRPGGPIRGRSEPCRNGAAPRSRVTQAQVPGGARGSSAIVACARDAGAASCRDSATAAASRVRYRGGRSTRAASAVTTFPAAVATHTRPVESRPLRSAPKAKEGNAIYDTLEQEMASLLGRPPGKTN